MYRFTPSLNIAVIGSLLCASQAVTAEHPELTLCKHIHYQLQDDVYYKAGTQLFDALVLYTQGTRNNNRVQLTQAQEKIKALEESAQVVKLYKAIQNNPNKPLFKRAVKMVMAVSDSTGFLTYGEYNQLLTLNRQEQHALAGHKYGGILWDHFEGFKAFLKQHECSRLYSIIEYQGSIKMMSGTSLAYAESLVNGYKA